MLIAVTQKRQGFCVERCRPDDFLALLKGDLELVVFVVQLVEARVLFYFVENEDDGVVDESVAKTVDAVSVLEEVFGEEDQGDTTLFET